MMNHDGQPTRVHADCHASRPQILRRRVPTPRQGLTTIFNSAPQIASTDPRLVVLGEAPHDHVAEFARAVYAGLTAKPKVLSSQYLYDDAGARLFERICDLPEYYLTRAERAILARDADAIAAGLDSAGALVELGSGNSAKTRLLIDALLRRRGHLHYVPVDISRQMLAHSSAHLLATRPGLEITALAVEYGTALDYLRGELGGDVCVAWLGSSIGNLERREAAAFVQALVSTLDADGALLIGIDLRKERAVLERAYDDAQGVTARFNANLLARINRELGGDFRPDAFQYRACYDEAAGSVDMYQISTRRQRVRIAALELEVDFAAGEPIHTERSLKYAPAEITALAAGAGARLAAQWRDPARRFTLNLMKPNGAPV